jgi:hypothetical protein
MADTPPTPNTGKPETFRRARSAITGRFVKLTTALRHPRLTIVETVRRRRKTG